MSKPLNNFVFFGGRILGYLCLNLLVEAGLRPAIVVINPDDTGEGSEQSPSLLKLAQDKGLSVMDFKQLVSENGQKVLKDLSPSVGFCAFFSRLLPASVIQLFHIGITNLHFSLLPEYRGQYPTVYAIFEGRKKTGVTLQWINEKADLGDIILQETIEISNTDTGRSLFMKCLEKAVDFFERQICFYKDHSWPDPQVQDPGKAALSPVRMHLPNRGEIDWCWSGDQIRNFIRAMSYPPHSVAEFSIGDTRFEIRHQNSDEKET